MVFIAISYHGRKGKTGDRGEKPPENFFDQAFFMLGKSPFRKEKTLQKRRFHSCIEKGRSLDLQLVCINQLLLTFRSSIEKHFSRTKVSTSLRDTWGSEDFPRKNFFR